MSQKLSIDINYNIKQRNYIAKKNNKIITKTEAWQVIFINNTRQFNVIKLSSNQAATNSMLKEIRIKILVKTVGKIDAWLLPLCLAQ